MAMNPEDGALIVSGLMFSIHLVDDNRLYMSGEPSFGFMVAIRMSVITLCIGFPMLNSSQQLNFNTFLN